MRVLVLKFCANIRPTSKKETNGGNTEINVCLHAMKKYYDVTVLTIDRYLDDLPKGVKGITWDQLDIHQVNNDYDLIFAFNGMLNCYGGVVSKESLLSYRIFNIATCPVIYAVTDTNIPIGDLSGWVTNAQSKGNYLDLDPRDYVIAPKKVSALTQTYDLTCLPKIWKKKECDFKNYVYFPFDKTVFFRDELQSNVNPNPTNGLIYFGNSRGGKRDKKFFEFYCHNNTPTIVYGNWDPEKLFKKFKPSASPTFMGKKDMYELHSEINNSLAHCYISDPNNEGTIITTRFYEAVLNRTFLFIDKANDKNMMRFKNHFCYVNNAQELNEKLEILKNDPELRVRLIDEQYQEVAKELSFIRVFATALDLAIYQCIKGQ
jgi:hypothetical protein